MGVNNIDMINNGVDISGLELFIQLYDVLEEN